MRGAIGLSRIGLAIVALVAVLSARTALPQQEGETLGKSNLQLTHEAGQSLTQLPDGRWLIVGGLVAGDASDGIWVINADQKKTQLSVVLKAPRSAHTATVLPDGKVLIFGGIDSNRVVLSSPEILDVRSGTITQWSSQGFVARAHHTATLLTDGRVLLAGGLGLDGQLVGESQFIDPSSGTVANWAPPLQFPRYDHRAQLLSSGPTLLSGGTSASMSAPLPDERFNPATNIFEPAAGSVAPAAIATEQLKEAPTIADSAPGGNAVDVPVDSRIAIRFNHPLRIDSINDSTISLIGPAGAVSSKVVGAEGGMLAFISPSEDLLPGTTYTAFVAGATDASDRTIALETVRFTTRRFESRVPTRAATGATGAEAANAPQTGSLKSRTAPSASASASSVDKLKAAEDKQPADDDEVEDWSPQKKNRRGQWKVLGLAGDPALSSIGISTVDLRAPSGQSGVSGHTLKLNGRPLAGVKVSVGSIQSQTDAAGRFLLAGVPTGSQQLLVDGTDVFSNGRHYTKHYISVQINAGQTTTLPQSVFLPRVDPATVVNISSPAAKEIILTHAAIPGLEVHIPKGTVLREHDGKIVTSVSITPLPIDRAPYPTPFGFSAYFTLQPGGAFVDGDASKAIRVIYPNYEGAAPGTKLNFYNYDPANGGWSVYGQGVVSKNGEQVIPVAGVGFRQLMGFGFAVGSAKPAAGRPAGGCVSGGDPVDCATGFFVHAETDMGVKDTIPITVTRTYQSNDPSTDTNTHSFGLGMTLSYDMYIYSPTSSSSSDVYLKLADGSQIHYTQQSTYVWTNLDSPTAFYGSVLQYVRGQDLQINAANDLLVLTLANHTVFTFASDDTPNDLLSISDPAGNSVQIIRQNIRTGPITQITSPNGRYIQFAHDSCNRITSATDNLGRTVQYTYVSTACSTPLQHVTDQLGHKETYAYDSSNRLQSLTDKNGNRVFYNVYNSANQVTTQTLADGAVWKFGYSLTRGIETTKITDPRGYVQQDTFNSGGYLTKEILAQNQSVQQIFTYQRYPSNLLASVTDPLSRTTWYDYDAYGDTTSITFLYGTANAVSTSFSYDPVFHQLASYYDIFGNLTWFSYDSTGSLNKLTNALGYVWTITNNGAGLPLSVSDPLDYKQQFSYQGSDLASTTDGLGRISSLFTDSVGRVLRTTDPLGNSTQYSYDNLDHRLQITDAMNGITTLGYDKNGNLTSVEDPRQLATHQYSPDSRNRLHIYTDPLGHTATYTYDGLSNLTSVTDRDGNLTQYSYDPLSRLTQIKYQDGSTIGVKWDAGNRPHIITDSISGVITQTFDGLDRLTEEQSPEGTVSYTYNPNNPLVQLTVNSNPVVSYNFDAAHRLTSITQGSNRLTLAPDKANRPSTITYPNGIIGTYTFDAANELASLNYTSGSNTVASFKYTYDSDGREISAAGNYLALNVPTSISQWTYDAANRLTNWNGGTLTYDNDGNLLTGAGGSYKWNARSQLTATSAGGASFKYDAYGRRISATISGATNSYLYDGGNAALISATQLLGTGSADGVLLEVGSSATTSLLADANNNTTILANSAGAVVGTYSYSPFGATSNSGGTSTSLDFTGRENDSTTNLYYYRARYYSPEFSRFISQDPLGVSAGINTYAYGGDNPISNADPSGLLFGLNAGEAYGDSAAQYWADLQTQTGNGWYAIPGALAALWTPCTSNQTFLTLAPTGPAGRGLAAGVRLLGNRVKGQIGEAASLGYNWLQGNRLISTQTRIPGYRTIVDSTWEGIDGSIYYVESKFGTSTLTSAQRAAAAGLGDLYQVERWGYDWVTSVGSGLGLGFGAAAGAAARSE